jgi:hypothetical protein
MVKSARDRGSFLFSFWLPVLQLVAVREKATRGAIGYPYSFSLPSRKAKISPGRTPSTIARYVISFFSFRQPSRPSKNRRPVALRPNLSISLPLSLGLNYLT